MLKKSWNSLFHEKNSSKTQLHLILESANTLQKYFSIIAQIQIYFKTYVLLYKLLTLYNIYLYKCISCISFILRANKNDEILLLYSI